MFFFSQADKLEVVKVYVLIRTYTYIELMRLIRYITKNRFKLTYYIRSQITLYFRGSISQRINS